jgi:hypothetical protein
MIFQPAIIALLLASTVSLTMLLAAAPFAIQVIRHWDIGSGSERQLHLERQTYLFSTLTVFVMATQLAALLLFVFNADKMSEMFVGAMCAVGTLNVNPYGFPALIAQMAVFFLAAAWLAINHIDTRAPDYPLVRIKYGALLLLLPAVAAVLGLQLEYFLNLKANVITSCCGSLFSEDAKGLSGDMAAQPPLPAMIGFYVTLGLAIATAGWHAWQGGKGKSGGSGYLVALTSGAAFAMSIAAILAFISLYLYEHPHHHCPFCILKPEYGYQGYLLYVPLFAATAAGIGAGAVQPFRRIDTLKAVVPTVSAQLATVAAAGFLILATVATVLITQSNLLLIG